MRPKGGQHIRRPMQPARPSLSDALRITDRLKTGRLEMGRRVFPPTRRGAGTGTRPSLDRGAQRSLLREHRRRYRIGLGRPKLGPSRQRSPQVGAKVGRRESSAHLTFPRGRTFIGRR